MSALDIKLDELSVTFVFSQFHDLSREHYNLLKTLYERGFYEHLKLSQISLFNDDSSKLLEFCSPSTTEINMCRSNSRLSVPPQDLREILLANNISIIEQIHFDRLKTENMVTFVQKCLKLRKIKIDFLDDVNSFDSETLNEERKKLVGARSVKIYLNKLDYNTLIVKMAHCELVKIKILKTSYE